MKKWLSLLVTMCLLCSFVLMPAQVSASQTQSDAALAQMDAIEAVCVLERYLDEAMRANLTQVRIIHGKGTGTLRAAVQQALKKNKFVKQFRLGQYGEGEDGVTIVEFR